MYWWKSKLLPVLFNESKYNMIDKILKIKVYYERPSNSNPYYATNQELNLLSKFIEEITTDEVVKDKLFLTSFKGGNRNPMVNECELDFSIKFKTNEKEDLILNTIDILANKYKAKYIVKRGEKNDC